jgi:hypothetical protein
MKGDAAMKNKSKKIKFLDEIFRRQVRARRRQVAANRKLEQRWPADGGR